MSKFSIKNDAYAALRIPDFRWFVLARFFITFAIQMQSIIVGWQVYALTKDPLALGLIGICEAIPFFSIALFAGHYADRHDRRKIILITDAIFIVCSFILFFFNWQMSSIFTVYGALPIYIVVLFIGLARGSIYPAQMGLMAQLVPRELYPNSSSWNSTVWHIAAVTGPAVGGLIYGFYGINAAYLTVVIVLLITFILYLSIKSKPFAVKNSTESIFESLSAGIKFVFNNQILLGAISLDMFAVLFGGAVAMLPVFASEILKVGPQGLGFLRAAPAVGAVIMSFFLAYYPPLKNSGRKLLFAISAFGLCIIFFGLSTNFYLSLVLLALSGMSDNVSVVIRQTIMQLYTPDEMRGRVASVNSLFIGSSNEIGAFESGVAARLMTLVPSVVFGGSMTLVIAFLTGKFAPKLKNFNISTATATKK